LKKKKHKVTNHLLSGFFLVTIFSATVIFSVLSAQDRAPAPGKNDS
jgi:hypothetical protein